MEKTIKDLEKVGVTFTEIDLPNFSYAIPAYYVIAPAECSANLSRYDGVRFGYRCKEPSNLKELYQRSRTEGLGQEVKNRIMAGTFALTTGYYDAYYRKAQQVRRLIKNDFVKAFKKVDLIIAPTTPSTAFRLGEKADNPQEMYLQDVYTTSANLAGLPALSMPAGFVNGLPMEAYVANIFLRKKVVRKIVGDWAWERGRNRGLIEDSFDEFQLNSHNLHLEIAKFSRGWTATKADLVITPSLHLKNVVKGWGVNEGNIKVIYKQI